MVSSYTVCVGPLGHTPFYDYPIDNRNDIIKMNNLKLNEPTALD